MTTQQKFRAEHITATMVPIKKYHCKPFLEISLEATFAASKKITDMIMNWLLAILDIALVAAYVRLFSAVPYEGDVDSETGLKMPGLKHGEDYADPVTGAKVTAYYEDSNEE